MKSQPERDGQQAGGAGSRPAKAKGMAVPAAQTATRGGIWKPPFDRLVDPASNMPLTPQEWKLRFANNLNRLLRVLGLSRKDAALKMHVSYRVLRRLVTAGVSRTDQSNRKSLSSIAEFFGLSSIDELWRDDLARRLMYTSGSNFVVKFRDRLSAEREKREAEEPLRRAELAWLNRALGFQDTHIPILTGPDADKVGSILASPEAETFRRLIDLFDELTKRRRFDRKPKARRTADD